MRIIHIVDRAPGMPAGRDTHLRTFAERSGTLGHSNDVLTAEEYHSANGSWTLKPDAVVLHGRSSWGAVEDFAGDWPTIAWVHDQSFVCPAAISWFRNSRAACTLPLGPWCVWNGYVRHCNARHPAANIRNVRAVAKTRSRVPQLDGVIVASEYMKTRLVSGGVEPAQIDVLPYFVRVPEPPPDRSAENPFRILYLGRVNEMKGMDVLIAAMARLPGHYELHIAGEGPALEGVRIQAREAGLGESQLTFSGFLPDSESVNALYASAAVVAVPSLWPEPFGIVGLEALARGKALVASRVGGIPEWMVDGDYGHLVTPDDPVELAARLMSLLDQPERRYACGDRGREMVSRRFTWEQHWDGFTRTIHSRGAAESRNRGRQRASRS
ncbi:MAG: glycosyltransferase family 4 protein [Gemmatimonadaceae bacterium]